jgi:hypothetical protein
MILRCSYFWANAGHYGGKRVRFVATLGCKCRRGQRPKGHFRRERATPVQAQELSVTPPLLPFCYIPRLLNVPAGPGAITPPPAECSRLQFQSDCFFEKKRRKHSTNGHFTGISRFLLLARSPCGFRSSQSVWRLWPKLGRDASVRGNWATATVKLAKGTTRSGKRGRKAG